MKNTTLERALWRATTLGGALPLLASSALAQISFAPGSTLATQSNPDASAAGDFDGDGDLDLATSADAPDRIVIRLNAGNGTFGAPISVQTGAGTSPHGVTAGDFDGDLDIDLLVSLKNVNTVRALINNGSGGFTLGSTSPVGSEPRNIESADLDGDGDRDAAVVNRSSDTVSVLRNQGAGTFTVTSYPAGSDPRTVALGDVTGDGRADLAVASHDTREIWILRNLGNGSFTGLVNLSVGSGVRPEGVVIADLDGDLDGDVAATTGEPERLTVFRNSGAGAFGAAAHFPTNGVNGSFLVAADFDLDGDRDIAIANSGSNLLSLLANNGSASFGAPQTVVVGSAPGHVLAAELDGKGSSDIVSTNASGSSITVLLNTKSGGSTTSYCIAAPNSAGPGAQIGSTGAPSIGANAFTLTVSGAPPDVKGVFFYGAQQTQLPFGDGFKCVGGKTFRLKPVKLVAANGTTSHHLDFTQPPAGSGAGQIFAGSTWNFQFWYRDPTGPGGTGMNLSDALEVLFAN